MVVTEKIQTFQFCLLEFMKKLVIYYLQVYLELLINFKQDMNLIASVVIMKKHLSATCLYKNILQNTMLPMLSAKCL